MAHPAKLSAGSTDKQLFDEGQSIDTVHANISCPCHWRRLGGKKTVQTIGRSAHGQHGLGARAPVAVQYTYIANTAVVLPCGEYAQQVLDIGQPQIQALTRQGMHSVGGVADQRYP